jgi:hypothetical protein
VRLCLSRVSDSELFELFYLYEIKSLVIGKNNIYIMHPFIVRCVSGLSVYVLYTHQIFQLHAITYMPTGLSSTYPKRKITSAFPEIVSVVKTLTCTTAITV